MIILMLGRDIRNRDLRCIQDAVHGVDHSRHSVFPDLNEDGLRALAVAYKWLPPEEAKLGVRLSSRGLARCNRLPVRNPAAISERDRAIYAAAYSQPDAIRAGNGWYQTFGQDIIDARHYGQIATPVLTLAGERNYPYLRELLPTQASDVRVVKVNSSSHYVPEDQPEAVVRELLGFFKS
jgi:pimeloyl-ACP methyl ester carboxylesterase